MKDVIIVIFEVVFLIIQKGQILPFYLVLHEFKVDLASGQLLCTDINANAV